MLKIELICDSSVSLLGKCLTELKEKTQTASHFYLQEHYQQQTVGEQLNVCQQVNGTHQVLCTQRFIVRPYTRVEIYVFEWVWVHCIYGWYMYVYACV